MNNEWISVKNCVPGRDEANSFGSNECSINVLATDGKYVTVAYHHRYTDHEYEPRWLEQGRDAYVFDDVTHWMPLPELP